MHESERKYLFEHIEVALYGVFEGAHASDGVAVLDTAG